ncbi:MAG: hypothetical protein JJT96_19255 [Opitutales bacterium]|nr:hypothetical protein [Opitutales bacterium]
MFWYPHKAAFRAGMNDVDVLYDPDTCTPIADESPGYFWKPWVIGEFSFAVGKNSLASGSSSFAAGDSNRVVFAPSGVAIGFDNYVEGMAGTAIGYSNDAWGAQSVALGFANTAEGSGSVALGDANEAIGDGSLAFGSGSKALSTASIAGGFQSEAKGGSGAVALGDGVIADGQGTFAVGVYNNPNPVDGASTKRPLFMVGRGSGATDRKNAFVVYDDGSVDITRIEPRGGISMGAFGHQ